MNNGHRDDTHLFLRPPTPPIPPISFNPPTMPMPCKKQTNPNQENPHTGWTTTQTPPPSPSPESQPKRPDTPCQPRAWRYRSTAHPRLSSRAYNNCRPTTPETETLSNTSDAGDSDKENWKTDAPENPRHHGISLAKFKSFCIEPSNRAALWEATENAKTLRMLLQLWWKLLDKDAAHPTIPFSVLGEIRRLENLGQDISELAALVITNRQFSRQRVIANLTDYCQRSRRIAQNLKDDRLRLIESMTYREEIALAAFLYMKDNGLDFWAGTLFYENGDGPDPEFQDFWKTTDGDWSEIEEDIKKEVLGKEIEIVQNSQN
jgi:hypothetical protein